MIYIFNHIVIRTRRELNDVYKSLFDEDYYDTNDESYNAEELITEYDACVKVYDDKLELRVNDGNEETIEFDMRKHKYRVEHWKNDSYIVIDECNEVLDPESYSDRCKNNGEEIRIYNNFTNKLIDSYRYEFETFIEEIADRIEDALKHNILDEDRERLQHKVRE